MKIQWKKLLICIAIPLILGGVAGFIAKDSMSIFASLNQPPLSPPGWLFAPVWATLYVLMGIASYLILTSIAPKTDITRAHRLYCVQLAFNFLWTFWFFNLQLYAFSFAWLAALWLLILGTIILFSRISKPAALLLVPYLLWVSFAGYLNLAVSLLN